MSEYVSQVDLTIGSELESNFKKVTLSEVEHRKEVKLMKKTGVVKITPSYKINLDYVIPADSAERDFEDVSGETITLEYPNGTRHTYTGVACLKEGGQEFDGENEAIKKVEFFAEKRIKE